MLDEELSTLVSLTQLDAFQCIGSSCEDTCCAGWNVQIDAPTIAKWSSSESTSHYKKHLRIVDSGNLVPQEAEIQLEKNGNCPFLDAEKLCKIQKENGHDYLSHVCRSFPRSRNSFFGMREESMSLACPEAARLILNAVEPIEIGFKEEKVTQPDVINMNLPSRDLFGEIDVANAWEFRSLIMKIIQNRSITLENRLILIGIISKNLDDELSRPQIDKSSVDKSKVFVSVYNKFKELLDSNQELSSIIPSLPDSPKTKLIFLKTLFNVVAPYSRAHQRYSQFFKNLVSGLKLDTNSTEEELISNYVSLRTQYLKNSNITLILENYIFHLFFKELFPYQSLDNETAPCLKQFLNLTLRIFLIKEHLIALSNDKDIVSSEAVSLIQSFTRVYEHSESFQKELKSLTNSNNFNSLPHLCILLQS